VLTTLDLSSNGPITAPVDLSGEYDASGIALADALKVNGVLTTLDLCANDLGDEGKGVIRGAVSGRVRFKLKM